MPHGTLLRVKERKPTTSQYGAEKDQLSVGEHNDIVVSAETRDHFGQASWLVRKAIAHLLLIDEPELGYEPDIVRDDLEEVQRYLERCRCYKVRKPDACPF